MTNIETWTYASPTSITAVGDLTSIYWPGMKVELVQTTAKYFIITSVVYSSPNTTITLWSNGVYTVANAAITSHLTSIMDSPKDFPTFRIIASTLVDYDAGKLELRNESGGQMVLMTTSFGGTAGSFTGRSANGTETVPTASLSGNPLSALNARGYGSTGWIGSRRGSVRILALETWTDTTNGTAISFDTTPIGSATVAERMRINDIGVGIGTTDPKSTLHVVGLPIYANNAAALLGGLTAGAFYRTGADPDPVCVVH
jgi:hypothetical protein